MSRSYRRALQASSLALMWAISGLGYSQDTPIAAEDDSSVVYPATYFQQYDPVSVNDMIDRIPGIELAMGRGGPGGHGGNRRGLGAGENEILINGQRITGKSNEGRAQLSRITADQVDYIEIIRGTSEELDIRGSGQVVNIVLLDTGARSSISAELNMDHYQDNSVEPGARLSYTGQDGRFNYLFHIEAEPRYENTVANETSVDAGGNLLETRHEESFRDQVDFATSFNLGYQFDNSLIQFNGLYEEDSPPEDKYRSITDFTSGAPVISREREFTDRSRSNWEVGGDYEYGFSNGAKYRVLFIANDREFQSTRERFDVLDSGEQKDLFLFSAGRDQERIVRTSYTWNLSDSQGLELGVEGAQTIRDNDLRLGLAGIPGLPSPDHGNLSAVAIDNATSTVEEIRVENFAVHNWQLNDRMSLESTLVFETSTIEQTGDVYNKRDFDFIRPKLDYRFDITPTVQLRATIEKVVNQLSFSDFSASSDNEDDDQNTQAGNPEIVQEQSWNYSLNLEYRLPNNIGVLNTELFYHDLSDVIDRVDVSPSPDELVSARGNIGDAIRYGLNTSVSSRLGYIGLPSALLTLGFSVSDSEVTDPFLGVERRLRWNNRWFGRSSFRHDITDWGFSYGVNYFVSSQEGTARTTFDIIDIERQYQDYGLSLFAEKKAFGGMTFRLNVRDANDRLNCRERIRFDGAMVNGIVEEIENYCSGRGPVYSLSVRHTF